MSTGAPVRCTQCGRPKADYTSAGSVNDCRKGGPHTWSDGTTSARVAPKEEPLPLEEFLRSEQPDVDTVNYIAAANDASSTTTKTLLALAEQVATDFDDAEGAALLLEFARKYADHERTTL